MKKNACFWLLILAFTASEGYSQGKDTLSRSRWRHEMEASFYIFSGDFLILPVYHVNKGWLHLEARYNYEEENTFSAWFGYNFTGGNKFQYTITPMAGGIAGNIMGIAPGLELTFNFYGFEFYSESEFVFDLNGMEGDFFYTWTDFSYSPPGLALVRGERTADKGI